MDGVTYGEIIFLLNIFSIGWLLLSIVSWRILSRKWRVKPREVRGEMDNLALLALAMLLGLLYVPVVALVPALMAFHPLLPLMAFWPTLLAYGLYRLLIWHRQNGISEQGPELQHANEAWVTPIPPRTKRHRP